MAHRAPRRIRCAVRGRRRGGHPSGRSRTLGAVPTATVSAWPPRDSRSSTGRPRQQNLSPFPYRRPFVRDGQAEARHRGSRREKLVAVIDAKYKRLQDLWPERPFGVERSDLYQLAAYLSRLDPEGVAEGMLLYPLDPEQEESTAEVQGRWRMEAGSRVQFRRIPISVGDATKMLREILDSNDSVRG